MHLHFERNTNTKCDCTILSLSWMGKVPDDIPEDDGWKLNRTNYYQEGWLATGNVRGIVGVTFTTSHCRKNVEYPLRTNYNLRGHRSDVILVKWNEPYQKLASCDSSGIIFVWIKYEGRWSIELINDRNTPVTHFSWSHDGRMALICYQDGFVLVGSVAGQRYWSSMLNLESTITCGIWTPDDQQVYFGTTQGQVIVMDVHGAMVSQVQLCNDVGITSMSWSCEKFKMEEGEESEPGVTNAAKRSFVLAVSFQNGFIYLLKSFDDVSPSHINTGLDGALGMVMEWSNSRELLAVAGTSQKAAAISDVANGGVVYNNLLKFYTETGALLYQANIPNSNAPVSALTWGHNDKRLFIATGTQVHIAWVSRRVASLQLLCRLQIQASIGSETLLPLLPLPSRIKTLIGNLFAQTIRCCVPDLKSLREFVSRPPICSTRLHCTMIRHDDDSNISSGTCYTLYLEYLGGLVPLLKGKRTSKIRPEFVIFDPQVNASEFFHHSPGSKSSSSSSQSTSTTATGRTDSSDSEYEDRIRGSPHTPRKRKIRHQKRHGNGHDRNTLTTGSNDGSEALDELAYVDTLPEEVKLVEVTSNIWGTKFKMHGLAKTVPANLGQVTYKTSLLHLQPRQMTLVITELRDDFPLGPDPSFNPNLFSEDEDENHTQANTAVAVEVAIPPDAGGGSGGGGGVVSSLATRKLNEIAPPIAPMSPRPNRLLSRHRNSSNGNQIPGALGRSPLARAESYDDDSTSESPEALPSTSSTAMSMAAANAAAAAAHNNNPSSNHKVLRPKNITSTFARSNGSACGQSRHAISPLFSDGSVPTLQSPKNAVAPTDIIFERPAVAANGQTTLMSYSSNADYTNNVVQVKNALMSETIRSANSHVNPVPLNLNLNLERMDAAKVRTALPSTSKKRDMLYIDDEMQGNAAMALQQLQHQQHTVNAVVTSSSSSSSSPHAGNESNPMKRTPTVVSIAPATDVITRSCSVGYLDSVAITPSDEALTALRREAPHKRLILVDNRKCRKKRMQQGDSSRPKLLLTGKSKSLDSCDLLSTQTKLSSKQLEKLHEETSSAAQKKNNTCSSCSTSTTVSEACKRCSSSGNSKKTMATIDDIIRADVDTPASVIKEQQRPTEPENQSKKANGSETLPKRRIDVITSFTDSPLFTRKHRFGNRNNGDTASPTMARRNEHGFSLVKQLTEGRWRRKDPKQATAAATENKSHSATEQQRSESKNTSDSTIEATPVESRASVSLHTQALTTLENIISRLRDLDEGRLTPPTTPQRLPRSSPASPAASKKNKRYQSSSPIRNILNSPLLNRRQRKKQNIIDSSDDEANGTNGSGEENAYTNGNGCSKQYRDLETFQKAQLRQKLKRGRIEPNGSSTCNNPAPVRREFVMHNKAPMWNEMSQVYQLDFGGRVTQESAKNFQIEFRGKQVMQFGRIDGNAYTLDFQYPFSALQAFAVALANVTQRLK
ncbi:tubby-related protein 4 isoform X2 [Stomoxys calcitrans]|uniref:tubby-related protein 4 isoform X2 n=1 Tax=Stomoxys calcitrans TaxID=35570 RepID=UPI0027E242EE|nr:tubby-related protein 4 isoform X2 [Stomoxys calcitrans]